MRNRLFLVAASALAALVIATMASAQSANPHIKNATAVGEVFGDGERITAVILEYDKNINSSRLSAKDFVVKDRNIVNVYASTTDGKAAQGSNGHYVVIELNPDDASSRILEGGPGRNGPGGPGGPRGPGGPNGFGAANGIRPPMGMGPKRLPVKATVTQVADIVAANGETIPCDGKAFETNKARNLIVDDFQQLVFKDPENGNSVKYNLYTPKGYDKTKSYPMVLFMHDASVMSDEPDRTLIQGLGAVVWASPEEQAKHPAFVLAPQLNGNLGKDENGTTSLFDSVYHLVKYVAGEYRIDQNRLYTTGQSAGCMASIAFDIYHPDLFAASMLVAGQWNAQATAGMIHQKLWIIVSEGDFRAFPGMNASIAVWEKEGARITRGRWSAREPQDVQAANVAKMMAEHNNIMYTTYIKGTTLPPGQENSGAQEHMASWQFAYNLPAVRDWLFAQSKQPQP